MDSLEVAGSRDGLRRGMTKGETDMIKAILWDVDGTLLDFHAAEYAAIKALFREMKLGICTDEMVARYSAINERF